MTRFNLLLWRKDKAGAPVRTRSWLEHRFSIFEKYCLPSVKNQTNKIFEWIVLFDIANPEAYKQKIVEYQKACPQFVPVYVETENGHYFARYFRNEVAKRLIENELSQVILTMTMRWTCTLSKTCSNGPYH